MNKQYGIEKIYKENNLKNSLNTSNSYFSKQKSAIRQETMNNKHIKNVMERLSKI